MPSQNPRINVVLNNLLYQDVRLLAEKIMSHYLPRSGTCSKRPLKFKRISPFPDLPKKGKIME